jgi:hypothetical protein
MNHAEKLFPIALDRLLEIGEIQHTFLQAKEKLA